MHTSIEKLTIRIAGGLLLSALFLIATPHVALAGSCDVSQLKATNYGQKGAHVKALQECLILAGYSLPAGATGYFGPQTRTALQSFYRSVMGIGDWDGRSIGPKGRMSLVERSKGKSVNAPTSSRETTSALRRITSESDLKKYLTNTERSYFRSSISFSESATIAVPTSGSLGGALASPMVSDQAKAQDMSAPEFRVSDTNVQVQGVDEPDILKTDGSSIFFSRTGFYRGGPRMELMVDDCINCGIVPPKLGNQKGVTTIKALPVSSLAVLSDAITERGEMLLLKDKKILLVIAQDKFVAYDVSDPAKPSKKWETELKNNTRVLTARLIGNAVYLITGTYLQKTAPCPIMPMMRGGVSIAIPCGDIWAPSSNEPVNMSYTVFAIDPMTGVEKNTLTVLGESLNSTIYVSEGNIYLAYRMQGSMYRVMADFLKNETADLLSTVVIERIRQIDGYAISSDSKMAEIENALEDEWVKISENERMRIENELENRMKKYLETHIRETDRTTILRIPLETLEVASSGVIPGHLLNQFSMDEWGGSLRVAVTVGDSWGMSGQSTVNDVYVLAPTMAIMGKITDLGVTERIYAARFLGTKGYLVTFRQTDPFYVLDLSNPAAPKMTGELKIPGYSAYLEPLSDDRVLGVGREGGGVKLSVFNVADPKEPTEVAKYILKDSWTEVEGNHRAFLHDEKHGVFFIPGGQGGYVFSYRNDSLELKATVSGHQVKRAIYIDDYMYVIGETKITVLDEKTWKEVNTLSL